MTDYVSTISQAMTRAKVLLGNLAVDCKLANSTPGVFVPGQSLTSTYVISDQKIVPTQATSDDFPGTLISMSDLTVYMLDPTIIAKTGDFVQYKAVAHRIVACRSFTAGTKVILQMLLLRQEPSNISWDVLSV